MQTHQATALRREMVERQLVPRGIAAPRVLAALDRVPRHRFLPPQLAHEAYADRAVAIDCGQTISQPYIVALMTEALELTGNERVLEVGTGSGYQTAVLAELAAHVISIERHEELSRQAAATLAALGYTNIELVVGDGTAGWPAAGPFDRIVVTAGAGHLPPALWEQLAEGGILVIPLGEAHAQVLKKIRKQASQPVVTTLSNCRFVPLVGAEWPVDE